MDAGEDIDAVHVLDNGHIILSTAGEVLDPDATLGGFTFGGDDLVDYDPDTGSVALYFDGVVAFAPATDEDVDAIYVSRQNSILTMGYPRDMCSYPPEAIAVAAGDPDVETVKTGYDGYPDPQIYDGVGGCIFAPPHNIEPLLASLDSDQFGTGQWDIETYMAVQHPGWLALNGGMAELILQADLVNAYDVDGITVDVDKDNFVSRWEVYLWELVNFPAIMPQASAGPADAGIPICYEGQPGSPPDMVEALVPDRRIMFVTVVNCADLKGGRQIVDAVTPHGIVALFLTEPMGGFDRDAMYAEVVDPAGIPGLGLDDNVALIRDHIVLME